MIGKDLLKLGKTKRILKIGNVAKILTGKEYKILCMRFGIYCEPYSLEKVGQHYKQSRNTIAEIEKQAFLKVQEYIKNLQERRQIK